MTEQKPFTVAIVGGGLVGAALAQGLLHRNINVQLYERNAAFVEVGASVGLNTSSIKALKLLSPAVFEACQKIMIVNTNGIAFTLADGHHVPPQDSRVILWGEERERGSAVHRGLFLEALTKTLPKDIYHFGKKLEKIEEPASGPLKLVFADGSVAEADAVVGCDGVGSHVRRHLLGADHPSARAKYAHRYCYRALLPAEAASKAIGPERATKMMQWVGKGSSAITVPIAGGNLVSLAAFRNDPHDWPDAHHLTMAAKKEDVARDFAGWCPEIRALVDAIQPNVDRWALFDFAENPVPFYACGRIVLAGDAAHATTPHLGSGAGFGFEDAAVLAELFADARMHGEPREVEAAFQAYNEVRRPKGDWLTATSRHNGELISMGDSVAGGDLERIEEGLMKNFRTAWGGEPTVSAAHAVLGFHKRLDG